jgi:hypothetical protein
MEEKMLTAKELMNQSTEEKESQEIQWLLVDAESDLKRNIELGERQVAKLVRERDQKVMEFVQGGELDDLLQYERDVEAKNDDVDRLKKILENRFPDSN